MKIVIPSKQLNTNVHSSNTDEVKIVTAPIQINKTCHSSNTIK